MSQAFFVDMYSIWYIRPVAVRSAEVYSVETFSSLNSRSIATASPWITFPAPFNCVLFCAAPTSSGSQSPMHHSSAFFLYFYFCEHFSLSSPPPPDACSEWLLCLFPPEGLVLLSCERRLNHLLRRKTKPFVAKTKPFVAKED